MAREATEMSNVDTARSAHQAFSRGDLAAVKEAYAEDAVWHSSDEVRPGGEVHGRDAIIEMMGCGERSLTAVPCDDRCSSSPGDTELVSPEPEPTLLCW
jgi:ketosteroid isomerase-like protein